MVSKIINFDYLNANKKDYQEFAKEFYQIMAKKDHLDLNVNFCDDYEIEVGNAVSICTFNINYQPTYIHTFIVLLLILVKYLKIIVIIKNVSLNLSIAFIMNYIM